jgi:hypothetical protein
MLNSDKPLNYSNALRHLQAPLARHTKQLPNWVVWKWIKKPDGKWTKPPFIASSPDRNAKNNDPKTWRSHFEACSAVETGKADGIGFCLLNTNICAFDIDDCRDVETMEIDPFAMELVKRANSYTEISPSGTGLRIIGTGSNRNLHTKLKVPNSKVSVETYRNCERYITISNVPLKDVTTELADIDSLLDDVVAELRPTPPPQQEKKADGGTADANGFAFLEGSLPPDLLAIVRDGVPVGKRSDEFFHAVGWLKDEGWSLPDVITLLEKYPRGIRAKYDRQWQAEVRRSYGKLDSKPKQESPQGNKSAIEIFWHGEPTGRELKPWLVKELIPETGTGLAAGQWGACKTFSMLDLAGSIATGMPFAGRDIVRTGGTLFVAAEGGYEVEGRMQGLVDDKLRAWAFTNSVTVDLDHLPFAWIEEPPQLKDQQGFARLIEIARLAATRMKGNFGVDLALVIIDTISASADFTDPNDAAEAQRLFNGLNSISKATGAFVMAVDHFGKVVETGTRGSSAKESSADVVLALLADRDISGAISNTRMSVRKLRGGIPDLLRRCSHTRMSSRSGARRRRWRS